LLNKIKLSLKKFKSKKKKRLFQREKIISNKRKNKKNKKFTTWLFTENKMVSLKYKDEYSLNFKVNPFPIRNSISKTIFNKKKNSKLKKAQSKKLNEKAIKI
jgi:hypothetical protein